MAENLLKKHKRTLSVKKTPVKEVRKTVLVGTYKGNQLEKWPGYYNYPLSKKDTVDVKSAQKVNEIWLFKGAEEGRFYAAEFVGLFTREELKTQFGYPATGKGHGENYLLYKISKTPIYDPETKEAEAVIVRAADFAKRSPKIARQIKAYLESPERKDPIAANLVPKILTKVPPSTLRVCEEAVQMDFFPALIVQTSIANVPRNGCYHIASLFAGCGGMDLGFIGGFDFLGKHYGHTGFDVVWANEINPAACLTYEHNFRTPIICGDVRTAIETLPSNVDLVMGGFPCQDISINGKMAGIHGKRSCLYTYIVEAVRRSKPRAFVAENVGGLLLKQNAYSFNTILSDFNSLGYNVTYHIYHAEDYGVPQTRTRIIFVGTREDIPMFSPPVPLQLCPVTAEEAISDLEDHMEDKFFSHVWSKAVSSREQGNRRLIRDRPGYTIRAECHGNIQFHYKLPRRISMREAARIQSFPDTFIFPCGMRETERQIGNAVPPVLAWYIANSLIEVFKKYDEQN